MSKDNAEVPKTFVVDQELLDLIGRCDGEFVIEYEVLAERCGHTRCARCYGKWEPCSRKARAVEFSSVDIGVNRITRAMLDAIKAHVAEREKWLYLADEHYKKLKACDGGFEVECFFRESSSSYWKGRVNPGGADCRFENDKDVRRRMLRTEWDKVEEHLAKMVELPDYLIPPNTQIVGGVEVVLSTQAVGTKCILLYKTHAYWAAIKQPGCADSMVYLHCAHISRMNLHRLKTGEIEMRTIKFEEKE